MSIPFIAIELDRPRKLRLTTASVIEFEQLTGKKFTEEAAAPMGAETYTQLLYIMLKNEDKDITISKAYDLIDESDMGAEQVFVKIIDAVKAYYLTRKSPNAKAPAAKSK